jgi:hypothetical protein
LEHQHVTLKEQIDEMKCENKDIDVHNSIISTTQDGITYSAGFRKAAYSCIENQVLVASIGLVMNAILNGLTGVGLDFVPSPSTFSQMAYEMGVLDDIQVGETVVKCDNLTLSWDATTLDGEHVNEVHVNLPTGPPLGLILQIAVLAGGATSDYVCHLKESIKDITISYAA